MTLYLFFIISCALVGGGIIEALGVVAFVVFRSKDFKNPFYTALIVVGGILVSLGSTGLFFSFLWWLIIAIVKSLKGVW